MKKYFFLSVFTSFFFINNSFAQFERGYADLVERLLPSVVSIATSQIVERRTSSIPELPEGHPFNDMFEDFFGNQMPKRENMTGLGSGFIISPEGYVVTNNHVISGADQITVIFNNGIDEVPAEWMERKVGKSNFKVIFWLKMYLRWYFYGLSTSWLRKPISSSCLKKDI